MKLFFDLLPLLIFFVAFKFYGIYIATIGAILASIIQVSVFWFKNRRFETMHLITLAIISVFGGLTVVLQNDVFIKWKPSIIDWSFAVVIFGSMLFAKKSALEYVLGGQISLPAPVWRKLNIAWALFFIFLGFLNLYVAFFYNLDADHETRTEFWVNFKVFGMTGLTILFLIFQIPFLAKYFAISEQR